MHFRSLSSLLLLMWLTCAVVPWLQAAEKPNVLFLFADDFSYEAMGVAGNLGIKTPNLDRLAQSGTRFTQAHNMGSWSPAVCIASRTMLMTGRSLWRSEPAKMKAQQELAAGKFWPLWMKQAGYATWMTGKWHVQAKAEAAFDVVKNLRGGMPKDGSQAYDRPAADGSDDWDPADPVLGGYWTGGKHWTEVTADDAIDFLDHAKTEPKPFFMYVAFNAPHDPRQSPQAYLDQYPVESMAVPLSWLPEYPFAEAMGAGKGLRDEKLAPFPRSERAIQVHRREYFALITHLDAQIGRVLDALEKSGKRDNTVVFFTADHGLSVGHHGLLGKQNPYEVATRAPFLMSGKGVPAGKVIDQPIWLQDGMATALDLAGLEKPAEVEFASVLPMLKGEPGDAGRDGAVYFAYLNLQRAITWKGHKMILYPTGAKARLFDLGNDPEEKRDLGEEAPSLPLMQELFAKLREWQAKYADPLDLGSVFPQLVGSSRYVAASGVAQKLPDSDKVVAKKQNPSPAMQPIVDDPKLPRVLIIGDSISIGYTMPVREMLKGKANVHRIPTNGGPTKNGIANIEKWLGTGKWDVIHFNWGLHDLKHMPDGKRQVEVEDYEKNLRQLVERMQKTGAKLIWATTTPVPKGTLNPVRTFGDVGVYNDLAGRVMKEMGVSIDDLNGHITPKLDEMQNARDVHFNEKGSRYLGQKVAMEIEALLPKS